MRTNFVLEDIGGLTATNSETAFSAAGKGSCRVLKARLPPSHRSCRVLRVCVAAAAWSGRNEWAPSALHPHLGEAGGGMRDSSRESLHRPAQRSFWAATGEGDSARVSVRPGGTGETQASAGINGLFRCRPCPSWRLRNCAGTQQASMQAPTASPDRAAADRAAAAAGSLQLRAAPRRGPRGKTLTLRRVAILVKGPSNRQD
ncbi:hypothetical protein ON010_g18040 [Phytophthora cinnamomi]|nr:hypothetical protein ON010_g18040 [Phytophthora cinnamomi]